MTIALGILASDGVLIASDREETSFNDTKYAQNKVRGAHLWTPSHLRNWLLVGAGDAHFIDVFAQSIEHDDFLKDERLENQPRAVFDDALERFYEKKVLPFGPTGGPDFQLVIAYQGDGKTHLFKSQQNAVLESRSFVTIGVGAMVAQPILSRLIGHRKVSLREAVMVASYAVLEAKDAVQRVGKETDILTMFSNGRLERTGPLAQGRLDFFLKKYRNDLEAMVFRAVAGTIETEVVANKVDSFRNEFAKILSDSFVVKIDQSTEPHN